MNSREQGGFTMIELIMVIVILGVLSAFALPKFADLGSDAEAAALRGALASVRSASGIVRAAYLANGSEDPELEGQVFTTVNGYLGRDEMQLAAGFTCGEQSIDNDHDFDCIEVGANALVIGLDAKIGTDNDGASCIKYMEATENGKPPVIIKGTLSGAGSDCS